MTNDVSQSESDLMKVGFWIWITLAPIYILTGTIGNIISILVLCRKKMLKNVSSMFLLCLTLSDFLRIITGLGVGLVSQLLDQDVAALTTLGCPLLQAQVFAYKDISIWMLACISIERVIATRYPHKYKSIYSRRNGCIGLGVILIVLLGINVAAIFGFATKEIVYGNNITATACLPSYGNVFSKMWPLIHAAKATIVPGCITIIGTLIILVHFVKTRKFFNRRVGPIAGAPGNNKIPAMTKLILYLNVVFFITETPLTIYLVTHLMKRLNTYPNYVTFRDPVAAALLFVTNIHLIINFLLYGCTGSRFREEFKIMMRKPATKCISCLTKHFLNEPEAIVRSVNETRSTTF